MTLLPLGITFKVLTLSTPLVPTSEPGGAFSYTNHSSYFISDLAFDPDGNLLVGVRVGCYGSWHSSYNHWGEMDLITIGASGLYDTTPMEYDISVTGDAGSDDNYGGVSVYDLRNDACDVHYLNTSADILRESGPHGVLIFDQNSMSAPLMV